MRFDFIALVGICHTRVSVITVRDENISTVQCIYRSRQCSYPYFMRNHGEMFVFR